MTKKRRPREQGEVYKHKPVTFDWDYLDGKTGTFKVVKELGFLFVFFLQEDNFEKSVTLLYSGKKEGP